MAAEGWRIAAFAGLLVGAAALSAYASWSYLTWPKAGEGERWRAKRVVGRATAIAGLLGIPIAVLAFVYGPGGEPMGNAAGAGVVVSPWLWVPGLIALEVLGAVAWAWVDRKLVLAVEPEGQGGGEGHWARRDSVYAVLLLNGLFWSMAIMAAAALHG